MDWWDEIIYQEECGFCGEYNCSCYDDPDLDDGWHYRERYSDEGWD